MGVKFDMKIAILEYDLSISGGGQRQVLELATYLQKKGHIVKIYCIYLDKKECFPNLINFLDIINICGKKKENNKKGIFGKIKNFISYSQFIKNSYKKLLKIMDSDFDVINVHEAMYELGYNYKKKYNVPTILMLNDAPGRNLDKNTINILFNKFFNFWINLYHKNYIKKLINIADEIIVLDKRNQELVFNLFNKTSKIIRSGLDYKTFKYKNRDGIISCKKILAVGILFPHRRFEDLINAIYILKNKNLEIGCTIVGSDKYSPHYSIFLKNLIIDLNLSKSVKIINKISDKSLIDLYGSSDIFVFPNVNQTWGLAVFEAMSCGTPVIVSKGCGAAEVLNDNLNSLLVNPKSPIEISKKIEVLIKNKMFYLNLSKNGRLFVEKNISWEIYGENMLNVFINCNK